MSTCFVGGGPASFDVSQLQAPGFPSAPQTAWERVPFGHAHETTAPAAHVSTGPASSVSPASVVGSSWTWTIVVPQAMGSAKVERKREGIRCIAVGEGEPEYVGPVVTEILAVASIFREPWNGAGTRLIGQPHAHT